MDKVLVEVHVPIIEEKFDIFLPTNKSIKSVIELISSAITEITEGAYVNLPTTHLYNKENGQAYDITKTVKEVCIENGSQIILY